MKTTKTQPTAKQIYRAIDEAVFEKKYGFSLALAEAAPELLRSLKELLEIAGTAGLHDPAFLEGWKEESGKAEAIIKQASKKGV